MITSKRILTLAVCLSLYACGGSNNTQTEAKPTKPTAEKPTPAPKPEAASSLAKVFPKYTSVFGINIRATNQVPDAKIQHAAKVMAEYLDNNDDGLIDNQQVVDQLIKSKATLIMASNENELNSLQSQIGSDVEMDSLQDLQASETLPNGAANGEFDGSLEEVLHLITHLGYANVYPEVFGEKHDSLIADAMDKARGGRFDKVPQSYPEQAWYTYDDETCDYSCMVTEYTYWALTSILGGQSFSGRLEQIQQEWKLNTKEKVRLGDPDAYNILTNQAYLLPSTLPDGNYQSQTFEIKQQQGSSTSPDVSNNTVIGATSASSCEQAAQSDKPACFIIKQDKAYMYGVIGAGIVNSVTELTTKHSKVKTIVLVNVPGSMDDDSNLKASLMVYDKGLNTELLANSDIASGGVDFFLAGNSRTLADGAKLGVHSWGGDDGVIATDLPKDHQEHKPYIQYYQHIKQYKPSDFYFFTLEAAPAESIHYMSAEELTKWKIAR